MKRKMPAINTMINSTRIQLLTVDNSKSKNSSSARTTNPVETVSYRLSNHFLYSLQKLDKNKTAYPTSVQAQNLITNVRQTNLSNIITTFSICLTTNA